MANIAARSKLSTQAMSTDMQSRAEPHTNVLLTTFAGLGLPRTLSLPVQVNTPIRDVVATIFSRLPTVRHQLIITTTSNKHLRQSDCSPVSTLLPTCNTPFLPLRLSARVCGGKGGFGSQLRAAGGRMSSRKNRNPHQNPNGSNRNLDGRRLRVIDSAKDLARYLATKPEMDAKEREEKRKRWESVVETAEKRENEIRSGKAGRDRSRLDAEFVESKDLAEEKTREAVLRAVREEMSGLERTGSESSLEDADESVNEDEDDSSGSSDSARDGPIAEASRTFFGWDDEEEEESEDEDEEEIQYEDKGKAKAS